MIKKVFSGIVAFSLASVLVLPASAYSSRPSGAVQNRQSESQNSQRGTVQTQSRGGSSSFTIPQQYMIDQGIMRGDGQGNYNLTGSLSRGAMMVMLVRAFDLNSESNNNGSGFSDVPSGSYYADAINTAKSLGIAKGNGASFSPDNNVTIQQAILFVERAAEQAGITINVDLETYFSESELSEYATREDIANLLYYALTGSDSELDDSSGSVSDTATAAAITYTIGSGETLVFDDDDFTSAVSNAADGETLSYVTFTYLSNRYGKLYYDYSASSSSNTAVSSGTKYYIDQSKYLSEVSFVPGSTTGTVTIGYTGYTTDGTEVTGTVVITVESGQADSFTYTYDTSSDNYLLLDSSDFVAACQ